MDERIKQSIEYLRSRGLKNGNALGFRSGMMDDIADLVEEMQKIIIDKDYEILSIMHSVDKWLDGDELKQDTVNRASTMRDKTIRLVEELRRRADAAVEDLKNCMYYSNPKNNNVCNFCKKDMAEYPDKCKGWSELRLCLPEWRGVAKGDGENDKVD